MTDNSSASLARTVAFVLLVWLAMGPIVLSILSFFMPLSGWPAFEHFSGAPVAWRAAFLLSGILAIGSAVLLKRRNWLFFYHCRDDEVVPFSHLALYDAQFPRAITRAIDNGGHQFDNDLTRVCMDIRGNDPA